jgi:hypothetical protein
MYGFICLHVRLCAALFAHERWMTEIDKYRHIQKKCKMMDNKVLRRVPSEIHI